MPSITENIQKIKSELPNGVRLVAVSKYHPVEQLQEAYATGQRIFGENHAQEMVAKAPQMPEDVQWHFIGHLQTNKVRSIMPIVSMIQSVDSLKLLKTIEKEASRINRIVDVLLQLHVAQEETKSGFSVDELLSIAREGEFGNKPHVNICGLMAMGTNTDNQMQVNQEFTQVNKTFHQLLSENLVDSIHFKEISMGMSDDWPIAVKQGATLVRIGTDIFGPRNY